MTRNLGADPAFGLRPEPCFASRPVGFNPGESAWLPALIAFYENDELRQKAINLRNGATLDYLDRRAINALIEAFKRAPK